MRTHGLREAMKVVIERAFEVLREPLGLLVGFALERIKAGLRYVGREEPRNVAREYRPVLLQGKVHERLVVMQVVRPGSRGFEKRLLVHVAHLKMVQRLLHVALEHFQADRDCAGPPAREAFEQRQLQMVRVRIVMLLAHEDDVGLRDIREHRLEVRKLAVAAVEDALRHVRGLSHDRRRQTERQKETHG